MNSANRCGSKRQLDRPFLGQLLGRGDLAARHFRPALRRPGRRHAVEYTTERVAAPTPIGRPCGPKAAAHQLRHARSAEVAAPFVEHRPDGALGLAPHVAQANEAQDRVLGMRPGRPTAPRRVDRGRDRTDRRACPRTSSTNCSAFFRPTRGTDCSVTRSRSRMARTRWSADNADKRDRARAGPTPLAPSTARKTWRSYGVAKPNNCHPSSLTTR